MKRPVRIMFVACIAHLTVTGGGAEVFCKPPDDAARKDAAPPASQREPSRIPKVDSAKVYLPDFIDERVFSMLCDDLELSDAQRVAADAEHATYIAGMKQANDEWIARNARLSDEVGWAPEGWLPPSYENLPPHAIKDRRFRTPEQQQELNDRSNESQSDVFRASRAVEQRFVDAVAATLSDPQLQRMERAMRNLRRNVFFSEELRPRRAITDLVTITPDIHALLEAAFAEDGELHAHAVPGSSPPTADGKIAWPEAVEEVLARFEPEFDAAIASRFIDQVDDNRRYSSMIKNGASQRDALEAEARTNYGRWKRRYTAIENATAGIAAWLREAGDEPAAVMWTDRVNAKWFPGLHQPESAEGMYAWMADRDVSQATREQLNALFQEYLASRRPLRDEAMRVRLRLKEYGVVAAINPEAFPRDTERMKAIDKKRAELCKRINETMRTMLATDEEKAAFDAALKAVRRGFNPAYTDPPP